MWRRLISFTLKRLWDKDFCFCREHYAFCTLISAMAIFCFLLLLSAYLGFCNTDISFLFGSVTKYTYHVSSLTT